MNKAKLSLTITAMVLVAMIAIVSIIAVFAARTQNFTSSVSVKYTSSQIVGKVSANYYVGEKIKYSGTAMKTSDGNKTELTFDTTTNINDSLSPTENIELDPEQKQSCVVFEYIFQNGLGDPISTDYMATLSFTGIAKNIKISTAQTSAKVDSKYFSLIAATIEEPQNFTIQVPVAHKEGGDNISTKYFYVKAEIESQLLDSEFSGNFEWDLENWDAPQIAEVYNTNSKSFNKDNLDNLLQTISGDASASTSNLTKIKQMATQVTTAKQMRESAGDDISITLGGLKWTATYLSTDKNGDPILTLWLEGLANEGLSTSTWTSGWTKENPEEQFPCNMYGASYIRAVALNNGGLYSTSGTESATVEKSAESQFALFTMSEGGLTQYLDTPSQVTWQEYGQNTKSRFAGSFSYSSPNENWSNDIPNRGEYLGENYSFNTENGHYYNYVDNPYNNVWKDDYLWLPSICEVGYSIKSNGIWEVSASQKCCIIASFSWSRTGSYTSGDSAYAPNRAGFNTTIAAVKMSAAVRPALHLNLALAASAAR